MSGSPPFGTHLSTITISKIQVSHVDSKTDSNTGYLERMSANYDEQEKSLVLARKGNEGHQPSREEA
jgi:hypothetical protein